MQLMSWKPDYSVGVEELDNQHLTMIAIINRLYDELHDALKNGSGVKELETTVKEMIDYAEFHFSSEEGILLAHAYPEFDAHKSTHDAYRVRVREFQLRHQKGKTSMSIEVLDFLQRWWTKHILNEDKKYSTYLRLKGIS